MESCLNVSTDFFCKLVVKHWELPGIMSYEGSVHCNVHEVINNDYN